MQVPNDEDRTPNAGPSLYGAVVKKPDLQAARQRLARTTGLTIGNVEADQIEAERQARLRAINPTQLRSNAPRTSTFLANPINAEVAHDNVENMSAFERFFREQGPRALNLAINAPNAVKSGLANTGLGILEFYNAYEDLAVSSPLGKSLGANKLPNTFDRDKIRTTVEGYRDSIRPKNMGFWDGAAYSGIESSAQSVTAILTPGGKEAALAKMLVPVAGNAYRRAIKEGLPQNEALLYAAGQTGIEGLTEVGPLFKLIEDLQIGTPLFKAFMRNFVSEQIGEQGATFFGDALDMAMLPSEKGKTVGEFMAERPEAALSTAIATLFGSATTVGTLKAVDYTAQKTMKMLDSQAVKVERAAFVKDRNDRLVKLAEVDKLLARAPETFKQFIDEAAADGAVTDLYVDRDVLLQTLTDAGIEAPAEVASQLASPSAPGSDVRIPVGEFVTYLSQPEIYGQLADHLKTEPGGLTYAQAQEQGKEALATLASTFDKTLGTALQDEQFKAGRDRVQEKIFADVKKTSRFSDDVSNQYAFIGAQMIAVQAKRTGLTPEEVLTRMPLSTKAGESRAGKKVFAEAIAPAAPTYDRANDPNGFRETAERQVMEQQGYTEEELNDLQTKREFDIQTRAKFDQLIEANYTPPTGESSDQSRTRGDQANTGTIPDGGGVRRGVQLLDGQDRADTGNDQPLQGLPARIKVDGQSVTFGPYAPAREAARKYAEQAGLPYEPVQTYQPVDPEFATRVAQAFEDMENNPTDPEVAAAYQAMIAETLAQWQAVKETGLVVEFIDGPDPYGNPRNAILDVVNNNHLWVYSTAEGFGDGFGDGIGAADYDTSQQPLLAVVEGETISGKPVLVNDIFRIVHDYFGHIKEGVGFRADGEENAYRSHAAMYSPLARRAVATETRGQNSWLNYGPEGDFNKTASAAETRYAEQKVGLLPQWAVEERRGDPEDGVLNQDIRNEPYPDNPFPDERVSTRLPLNKGSPEDPNAAFLNVSVASMEQAPDVLEANAQILLTYPGFKTDATEPAEIVEAYIQFATDNLLWLHDQIPEEITVRSRQWYDGARVLTEKWSEQYDQPPRVVAAVIAALSPQKDWYQNVSLAERILGITAYKANVPTSNAQFDMAYELYIGAKERENRKLIDNGKRPVEIPNRLYETVESLRGLTLNQLNTAEQRAMWVRSYDQTYNSRGYRVTTPEGEFVGDATGKTAWGSNVEIAKAIEAIRNPSRASISQLMGTKHKVRSFYNNIIAPLAGEDVTIDTHVVAAALLRPLSGLSTEVHHNFGSSPEKKKQAPNWQPAKNSNQFGLQGTYAVNAEAYRRAAAQRGLLPREMQSITWEAIRGLFEAKAKTAKGEASLTNLVNLEWIKYQDGTQTLDETRDAILTLAGGIESPTWLGYDYSAAQAIGLSSYDGELASPELSRGRPGQLGAGSGNPGRITSGVGENDLVAEGVLNQYDPGLSGFRSTLYDTVKDKGPNKATASDWRGLLDNAAGVKKEEIEDTGLYEFLDIKGIAVDAYGEPSSQPILKSDVLQFIEQNGAQFQERILSADAELDFDDPRYYEIEEQVANEVREEVFEEGYVEPEYVLIYGVEVDGAVVQTGSGIEADRPEGGYWFVVDAEDYNWTEFDGHNQHQRTPPKCPLPWGTADASRRVTPAAGEGGH